MEYVEGLDLARRVKAKGPLPIRHACYFVHQAALGLQHAHEAGIVHRDIKPGNLMLTYAEGKAIVKVLDFGLAKAGLEQKVLDVVSAGADHESAGAGLLTQAGQLLGTPDFIAPEQITDAQCADVRADVYSLGCTLYYLLSGRPPFPAAKLHDVLLSHQSTDARLLNLLRPEIPTELAAVVAKMMAKEADRRYQTPSDVAKALVPFFAQQSAHTVSSNPGTDPVVASVAGRPAAEPTRVETQAVVASVVAPAVAPAVDGGPGTESNLDERKQSEKQSAGVADAPQPVRVRASWLRPALVVAVSLATMLVVGTIIVVTRLRSKSDTPVETVASTEPERGLQIPPVEIPSPSPDVSTPDQNDTPIPAPLEKPPEPPSPLVAGPPPTPAPAPPTVVADVETPKRIETPPVRHLSELGQPVQRAIREGVRFLKNQQRADGSWADVENEARTGTTSLITLALLTTGESPESPPVRKALEYLRGYGPSQLHSTYAVALQTMVFAAAEPDRDRLQMAANVQWLTRAQIKPGDAVYWPGSWTYSDSRRTRPGDNSNTQFALLGLFAASEVGVPVDPVIWELSRYHWERSQRRDGSWAYTPDASTSSASMTCAGISALIMTRQGSLRAPGQEPAKKQSKVKVPKPKQGRRNVQASEFLDGDAIHNCGNGGYGRNLQAGIEWLANHFQVGQNFGSGQQWKLYYLYGLERVGRLAGVRFLGQNDWYLLGAEELVHEQNRLGGFWTGALFESDKVLATSLALLFLAKGRASVLINKLSHGRYRDWNNDPDDIRNIVGVVSRDWKTLLTWQVVDSTKAKVSELLQAPIVFFNGHRSPDFSPLACERLRKYVEKGGFIFADACCGSQEFDQGFKKLIKQIFPEEEYKLRQLSNDHPVWRAKHQLTPDLHPLWGIDNGRRTVVIYSPQDLSCYWNQAAQSPINPAVTNSIKIGQNVIDLVTSGKPPPDKLFVE
jgi:serine/threonine protein kinase